MRYDGTVKIVKDDALIDKVRAAMPQIMDMYDKNGWEMGCSDSTLYMSAIVCLIYGLSRRE